jgi:uncharacterized protein (UPF0276 family)
MAHNLSVGLGLKPQHFEAAHACAADGLWFEVHPENYMVAGGPRLAWLELIRSRRPIALHGVALSLAADAEPDRAHLARLARLCERIEPVRVTEHLAWSTWRGVYRPDLLPFPRSLEALRRVAANVSRAQDALRRPIAVENPSHYLKIDGHEFDEIDFLRELARRTGCGLLLDVNNVYVSSRNLGFDAAACIDAFPAALIEEIHLAGNTPDATLGERLLIDSHDAPIAAEVWALYERLIDRIGPRPTLIERDENLPSFDELLAERQKGEDIMRRPALEAA